jgi:hypothetical protein
MFWLSYERWDFADFGEFWYKLGGRTTGVGVQAGNRLSPFWTTAWRLLAKRVLDT